MPTNSGGKNSPFMVFRSVYHFGGFDPRGVCFFTRVPSFIPPPGRVFVSASESQGRGVVGFHVQHAVPPPSPVSSRGDLHRALSMVSISPHCIPVPGIYRSPGMKDTLFTAGDWLMTAGRAISYPELPILTRNFPFLF